MSGYLNLLSGSLAVPADFCGNHFKGLPVPSQGRHLNTHDMAGCAPYEINTADAVFNWSGLDAAIAAWGSQSWTYCLWGTPRWASARPNETVPNSSKIGAAAEWADNAKLTAFVTALVNRYPTLTHVEIWNEPDIPTNTSTPPYWFSGTMTAFVSMASAIYAAVKAARPAVVVIGPGVVSYAQNPAWLDSFYAAGGDAYVDAYSYHGYQSQYATPWKALLGQYHNLRYLHSSRSKAGLPNKSIYCSEMGQTNPLPAMMTDDQIIQGYRRSMIVAAAAGAKHANWYCYDGFPFDYKGRPAVESAVAQFVTLLSGSTLSEVAMDTETFQIVCRINGYPYVM